MQELKKLAYSNIAFSTEVLDFLLEYKSTFNVYLIQNRELKLRCIDESYKFTDGQECLLYILWKFNNISMLVKSKRELKEITPKPEMLPFLKK